MQYTYLPEITKEMNESLDFLNSVYASKHIVSTLYNYTEAENMTDELYIDKNEKLYNDIIDEIVKTIQ